jgi:hypothetical protein
LQHPHIVQIYEIGEHGGQPFFSLEFVAGGSLSSRLNGTPWPAVRAARLMEQLAQAMHAAHLAQLVHRDLKPGNVLLTADDTPKVTDFGLVKPLDGSGQHSQSGMIIGTPSYMAPEQADGRGQQVGPAADVYALGAILYELLTGRPPFKSSTPVDTLRQVLDTEPVAPRWLNPQTPRDLETICLKCLHKEPARRYENARELAEDLRRFQAHEPVRARPVGRLERGWRWCRRKPAIAGLLAAVLLLAVCLVVVLASDWANFNRLQARMLQARLLEVRTEDVPAIIQEMQPYRRWLNPSLRDALDAADADARKQLRLRLALVSEDTGHVDYLVERLLTDEPAEVVAIRAVLRAHAAGLTENLWQVLQNPCSQPGRRLRAAVALAQYAPDDDRWMQVRADVATRLAAENFLLLGHWADALKPIRRQLLGPLAAIL